SSARCSGISGPSARAASLTSGISARGSRRSSTARKTRPGRSKPSRAWWCSPGTRNTRKIMLRSSPAQFARRRRNWRNGKAGFVSQGDAVGKLGKSDTVRFGIVGCGRIAQTHLQALATLPEAKLTAAIENRPAVGQAVAADHKCKLFADYRDPAIADLVDA